jgi:glycosyltransferase involved in cell wall biosynthesis
MRIAQIAPLAEPVPPERYGGTERVVGHLIDELVRHGHEVTLFASGDSTAPADLIAPTRQSLRTDPNVEDKLAPHIQELGQAIERAESFDIMHSHVDYVAFPAAALSPTPMVHTLHGRLDLPHLRPLFAQFHGLAFVSISDAQRAPLDGLGINWVATVYHGLPLDEYPFGPDGGDELVYLARISPEKRPDLAIEVAKRAGMKLTMAAKIDPTEKDYFERDIRPLLDHPLIEFVGEVDHQRKVELLTRARALLFPIDWPEPFGLVMIEAMACGTPVVTRPCGAVPEIVTHERTGLVASSVDELVDAVKRVDRLDRRECRREVKERFSASRMATDYERVYRQLVERSRAAS